MNPNFAKGGPPGLSDYLRLLTEIKPGVVESLTEFICFPPSDFWFAQSCSFLFKKETLIRRF